MCNFNYLNPYDFGPEITASNNEHIYGLVLRLSNFQWGETNATVMEQFENNKGSLFDSSSTIFKYRDETHNVIEITKKEAQLYIDEYEAYLLSIYQVVKTSDFQVIAAAIFSAIHVYKDDWKINFKDHSLASSLEWVNPLVQTFGDEHFKDVEVGMNDIQIGDVLVRSKFGEIPDFHKNMAVAS